MLRYLPNAVTVSRGALGPAVALCSQAGWWRTAFWLYLLAILTDLVDGWLARRFGYHPWGPLLDPLADRVLAAAVWWACWVGAFAPAWLCGLFLVRSLGGLVVAVGSVGRGWYWPPNALGQTAVAFEGTALAVLLYREPWLGVHWPTVGASLAVITLALSMPSGIDSLRRGPVARAASRSGNG